MLKTLTNEGSSGEAGKEADKALKAFSKLNSFFPAPRQWHPYRDKKELDTDKLPFVNEVDLIDEEISLKEKYVLQAKALLELYRIKEDLTRKIIEDKENSDEEEGLKKNTGERPSESILNQWIQEITEDAARKDSANYKAETREIYLKTFLSNPTPSPSSIRDDLLNRENLELVENESTLKEDLAKADRILYNWEKSLIERIKKGGYEKYAQSLERS